MVKALSQLNKCTLALDIMAKLTGYNIRVCLVVIIATFSNGFGAASLSTSVGQPAFYAYFDLDPTSLRTCHQG